MVQLRRLMVVLTPDERRDFLPEPLWSQLAELAPDADVIDSTALDDDEVLKRIAAQAPEVFVTAWSGPRLCDRFPPSLRYVCYLSGSVKHLVRREHLEQGVKVTNWGSAISRTIAEAALLHILNGLRRTTHWAFSLHQEAGWHDSTVPLRSLFGRRVGLHGFGAIARELVTLLRPFGCSISVYAPDVDAATEAKYGVRRASALEELFRENDVVVELAPLIPQTTGLVTEAILRQLRPGSVFVNVGRGSVVDEAALARVAAEGQVQFGLDVFTQEPLPADSPLRGLRNVTLTPHVAGPTPDRRRDSGELALRNLRAYAAGEPLEAAITPERYDSST
jgi:phosphoglycerate dehydrogenase-like enzyme